MKPEAIQLLFCYVFFCIIINLSTETNLNNVKLSTEQMINVINKCNNLT